MTNIDHLRTSIEALLGREHVISDPVELRTYECDGLTGARVTPALVALPSTTEQVASVVRACRNAEIPYVARGAGTGLSGGALPVVEGIVISLQRMRAIRDIDLENLRMTVEPGVTNAQVSAVVSREGLYYAPDPSSQIACTVGGNVAENSGGAHCLKYGFTTHHVLAIEVVLPDGSVVTIGGDSIAPHGFDLRGMFIGSEGTLGIATAITVRLLRRPESVRLLVADFDSIESAGDAVSGIIAAGIIPAAIELMDQLSVGACELAVGAGFNTEAAAVLIVELDGPRSECGSLFERVDLICRNNNSTGIRIASDDEERALIWKERRAAFAAMGRISPNYFVQDGVVPRTRLTEALRRTAALAELAGLRVANVFHAGDGNLHPLVLYRQDADEADRAEHLATQLAEMCVELGGSLSGEHGIGTDKACSMGSMFSEEDLEVMQRVRRAFDPQGLCNPGKIFPTPRLCGEPMGPYRPHVLEAHGVIERT